MQLWQVVGICFLDNYGAMIYFVVLLVFGWLLICGYGRRQDSHLPSSRTLGKSVGGTLGSLSRFRSG
jgi:hypothetical protein